LSDEKNVENFLKKKNLFNFFVNHSRKKRVDLGEQIYIKMFTE